MAGGEPACLSQVTGDVTAIIRGLREHGHGKCAVGAAKSVANKRRTCYFALMPLRACRVTLEDMNGVTHTVEVTAGTLYEAVAQGLAAMRGNEWVAGIAEGLNAVKVSVADVRVEHAVKMIDFKKWLERPGGSPREVSQRQRIHAILGTPVAR